LPPATAATPIDAAGQPAVTPVSPVGPPTPEPAGWSPGALATLARLSETLVDGDHARRARLAAASLDIAADPAQVARLRLVLRVFESRIANLLLCGRPVRFSDLDQAGRERYLRRWATSAIPLRRTAYQGLKRLLVFLAYADPGERSANPQLASTGYRHRPEQVTSDPTPIRAIAIGEVSARTRGAAATGAAADAIVLETDVAVVGSGAGGGVLAAELARAGRDVVVLEAGPLVAEPEMPTDELAAFDRLYLNHGFNVSWDASIMTLAGGTVGGGTTANWMTCIAPPAPVRRRWAIDHGVEGFDGPQVDADLATIEAELDVGPVPNVPPKDELIRRGATSLGLEVAETRRNGIGCGDCGRCGFGCRRGAKQSGLRVHLADAWGHGARIVADAPVDRVRIEGGRVTGVDATVTLDGMPRRLTVRAHQVVVAAGALRSPVVLLRSGLDHRATGRHLRLHPVTVLAAFLEDDVLMWQGTSQAMGVLPGLDAAATGAGHEGGFMVESAPGTPGLIALVFDWEGREGFGRLMARVRQAAPLIGIVADQGSGRVRLSRTGRPRIDYALSGADRRTLQHALATCARIAWAGGSRELLAVGTPSAWLRATGGDGDAAAFAAFEASLGQFDFAPNRGTVVSAHQMGSVRAGGDPATHPCDPWGRVRTPQARRGSDRTVRGLYVGDASLFPTAVGVNPMITTMLWARRIARTVLAEAAPG
jgi:choline dehydrogenase-like flavoprotein